MKSLIERCKENHDIVCYGAGDYARHITTYLLDNNINISTYCITDTSKERRTFFGTIIKNVDDTVKCNADALYILAADKAKRKDMYELLRKYGVKNVYKDIDEEWITQLKESRIHEWHFFLNSIIYNEPSCEIPKVNGGYEKKIANILKKYSEIEIRLFPVWHIAELVDEYIYYKEHFPTDYGKFVLLYPMRPRGNKPFENIIEGVNSFLCKKIKSETYELVTNENIDFWKYFIKHYSQCFLDGRDKFIGKKISCFHADMVRLGQFCKRGKSYVDFSSVEIEDGQRLLNEWGIKKPYVCLFSRDGLYYDEYLYEKNVPESVKIMDEYRNSHVDNLKLTCDYLQEKNVKCIRMGVKDHQRLDHPNCLEYVNHLHSPFMDFYLNANCLFYMGDSSGAICMAGLFDKPTAIINYPMVSSYDVEYPPISFVERDLCIYQKYWDKRKNKFLSLNEMIDFETRAIASRDRFKFNLTEIYKIYHDNEIVVIKNTAEEILDLGMEMYERIVGDKHYDEEEEDLQYRYQKIIERAGRIPGMHILPMRVGNTFLKKNQWLLE